MTPFQAEALALAISLWIIIFIVLIYGWFIVIRRKRNALAEFRNHIVSLQQEQPEVDLDFSTFAKEIDVVFNLPKEVTKNTEQNPLNWEYAIARHFYELGLKAAREE